MWDYLNFQCYPDVKRTMPATTPRVSILMLTYNRPQRIGVALTSIREQSFSDWEVIVVQDGDNPLTERIVRGWIDDDPRVRYFPRHQVGTIAEASNFGLAQARGEYVAILDDDDAWCETDKLQLQVDFLDNHPGYVACAGGCIVVDERSVSRGSFLKPEQDSEIRSRALIANPIINSSAMFRRVVGGEPVRYDESMRQFADWDFWLQMGARGLMYNFPRYFAHYVLWNGGSSFRNQAGNASATMRIIFKHRLHYPGFAAALVMGSFYFCYSRLPLSLRQVSYGRLSALKKALVAKSADA